MVSNRLFFWTTGILGGLSLALVAALTVSIATRPPSRTADDVTIGDESRYVIWVADARGPGDRGPGDFDDVVNSGFVFDARGKPRVEGNTVRFVRWKNGANVTLTSSRIEVYEWSKAPDDLTTTVHIETAPSPGGGTSVTSVMKRVTRK